KAAQSRFYKPDLAKRMFQGNGKEEKFAVGQTIFEEASKGGIFKAPRMYYIAEGEVALTIGAKALDSVRAGEIVGEMAVISERPRSATATAKKPCVLYSVSAGELQTAISKEPEFALMLMSIMFERVRFVAARIAARKIGALAAARESPVFDPQLLAQFESALPRAQIVRYQSGASIMKEGQAGMYMYVVKIGRIYIHLKDKVLEGVGPGGIFGEMALVDQSPRVANA